LDPLLASKASRQNRNDRSSLCGDLTILDRREDMVKRTLSDSDWNLLVTRIRTKDCTPFLGAGACFGTLPLGKDIALEWANEYQYPFSNREDLVQVAQYLAILYDRRFPKDQLLSRFRGIAPPNFNAPDEPHGLLADLKLPVYMTTNYDDFMVQAVKTRDRDPRRALCRWSPLLDDEPSVFDQTPPYVPTPANPVVYHLHGHDELPLSLVLTEDDYLEFLANLSRIPSLLPPRVVRAISQTSLLFIGYSLADINFRVLLQLLRPVVSAQSFAVMYRTYRSEEERAMVEAYLDKYYGALKLRIYWGTAREFATELREWMLKG